MSRRKLSAKDWAQLNRGARVGVYYPPGGRAEIRVPTTRERRRRRKKEGG